MNRRDLIKAALTLPVLNATRGLPSICASSCAAPTNLFQLRLEGPFGLILHKDPANPSNITGITAFMPVDPSNRHRFAMQGQPRDVGSQYSFSLTQTKPPATTALCVDSGFSSFCVDSTSFSTTTSNKLLTVDLAVPTSIIPEAAFPPMQVVFQSKTAAVWQRAFALEYDLNVSPLQLTDNNTGKNIPLTGNSYLFEVGLDPHDPDGPGNPHARDFYNKTLLSFFPDLQNNANFVVAQVNNPLKKPITPRASTYECKAGGIIGGNP